MADLTTGRVPVATGATQVDDSSRSDDGSTVTERLPITVEQPITSTYASITALGAAIGAVGSGGTDGATVLTVAGGTLAAGGVAAQFDATITGGILDVTVPLTVHGGNVGPYTVVPTDPVSVTSSDAGPLIGAQVNFGSSGWSYAPAIVGNDATKGLGFDNNGQPLLNSDGTAIIVGVAEDGFSSGHGVTITSNDSVYTTLAIRPLPGISSQSTVDIESSGSQISRVNFISLNGPQGQSSPTTDGQFIADLEFNTLKEDGNLADLADLYAIAYVAGGKVGVGLTFNSKNTSGIYADRLVIDGPGDINHENGHTNFVDTAPAVASDSGTPTLDATASDTAGTVTEGTGTSSTTITFHKAFAAAPHVGIFNQNGIVGLTYTVSTTAIVVSHTVGSGGVFTYHVFG